MTDIKSKPIGDRVRRILNSANLNIKEAAALMNIGRETLSFVVNEQRPLTIPICCRLEAAFGCNAEELFLLQVKKDLEETKKEIAKENIQPYKPEQLNHL